MERIVGRWLVSSTEEKNLDQKVDGRGDALGRARPLSAGLAEDAELLFLQTAVD